MPFTLSHPAAVLPVAALLRGRLALPTSAMVAGSTVPDLPLFVGTGYAVSHSPVGLVTLDLALAMGLLLVWDRLVRDALADLAPDRWRSRVAPRVRLDRRGWALAPFAAVLGSVTHVVWDAFTHDGRWGTSLVPWLEQDHLGVGGADWAQYGSSVVGLLAVVAVLEVELRSRAVVDRGPRLLPWPALPVTVTLTALVGVAVAALSAGSRPSVFGFAVDVLVTVGLGLLALSGAWWLVARTRGGGDGGRPGASP